MKTLGPLIAFVMSLAGCAGSQSGQGSALYEAKAQFWADRCVAEVTAVPDGKTSANARVVCDAPGPMPGTVIPIEVVGTITVYPPRAEGVEEAVE